MNLVTESQLDAWVRSSPEEARRLIPELVWRLVAAACPRPSDRRFPLGDSIGQHGADGVLNVTSGFPPFVPDGLSYWEIGTNTEAGKKATGDYKSLTLSVPADIRELSTFVFVTPFSGLRDWPATWKKDAQEKWLKTRRAKKEWKDVRVIDGTRLVDWMHMLLPVELWFAKCALGMPVYDMDSLESRWQLTRSIGEPPPLHPEVFLCGRRDAANRLQEVLNGNSVQLRLSTRYPDQVADFVAAHVHTLPEEQRAEVAGSCVVVSSVEAWKSLATFNERLILIADVTLDFSGEPGLRMIQDALRGRHSIILGGQPSNIPDPTRVFLPDSPTHELQKALVLAGYGDERARLLAQNSEGNLAALLRCLQNLAFLPAWSSDTVADNIYITQLLGAWDETKQADRTAAELLSGKGYGEWIQRIREAAARPSTPLTFQEGHWRFVLRYEGWFALGSRVYDEHLTRFAQVALAVLGNSDPRFDLPKDQRIYAHIRGQVLQHSDALRSGLAETLALLGSHPRALNNCSFGRPEKIASNVVRRLLSACDWRVWATLGGLLPLLAEASPEQFLVALEESLESTPELFGSLFAEEGDGLTGSSLISGLLWALETLAWDEELLGRVTLILGQMAALDPGGRYANRPKNSLTSIFLPWFPQTIASLTKKSAVVSAMALELPEVAWELILSLLPEPHGITTPNSRPAWRRLIPDGWQEGVSGEDYHTQIEEYLNLAVQLARTAEQLGFLVAKLDDVTPTQREKLLEYINGKSSELTQENRSFLWEKLTHLAWRHERFSHTHWALSQEERAKIQTAADKLKPSDPFYSSQRLFDSKTFDLMDGEGSFEEQLARLESLREAAVRELLTESGLPRIFEFAAKVDSPSRVGLALGKLASDAEVDAALLPGALVQSSREMEQFISGFVWGRCFPGQWAWVDMVVTDDWQAPELGQFFAYLPFQKETWSRVARLLGDQESEYWTRAGVNAFHAESDLGFAVSKLLDHGRPHQAIGCLSQMLHDKLPFGPDLAIRALTEALHSKEPPYTREEYLIEELIKHLQSDPQTDPDQLFLIEWYYLGLLDGQHRGTPSVLWQRLASSPDFFLEVIQLVFRAKGTADGAGDESRAEDDKQALRSQAFRLLWDWKLPPGSRKDGSFSGQLLRDWLEEVEQKAKASGHLESALDQVGKVLKWAPPDPDGLWIHREVAAVLNRKDSKIIRQAFQCEFINSRGAHFIDPSGQPERELAAGYKQKAVEVENAGFLRLAATMRSLAESYLREAERIVSRREAD